MVEKFNQTLKQMMRRVKGSTVALLLFAYREVPQASTRFSPFELVYGCKAWMSESRDHDDIVSYVSRIHERMEATKAMVHKNMKRAQQKQKQWYDQQAQNVELKEGD